MLMVFGGKMVKMNEVMQYNSLFYRMQTRHRELSLQHHAESCALSNVGNNGRVIASIFLFLPCTCKLHSNLEPEQAICS